MTKDEAIKALGPRLVPILQEFGVEALVVAGYISTDGVHCERFVAGMIPPDDAPKQDGMRHLLTFATIWAAPARPNPPQTETQP